MLREYLAAEIRTFLAGSLLCIFACASATDTVEADKQKLRGYWNVVFDSRERFGTSWQFVYFTNDKLIALQEDEYSIDPTQTPKHINLRGTNWQGAVVQNSGIYELTSDTLRICWAIPDSRRQRSRPAAFQTNQLDGGLCQILKRGDSNEGEFTYYQMETQAGTVANRTFRDEQGRVAVTIYYRSGPLYGVIPDNLRVHTLHIYPLERRGNRQGWRYRPTPLSAAILKHLADSQGFDVRYATEEDLKALSTLTNEIRPHRRRFP